MQSPVKLYIRVRLPDGSYPYLKPAYTKKGRIRPHHAMHNGKAVLFPGSVYYLRVTDGGKRVWESAGDDASLTEIKVLGRLRELKEKALGIEPSAGPEPPTSHPAAASIPVTNGKRLLADCAAEYIAEIAKHKSQKTFAAYRLTVLAFCVATCGIPVERLDDEKFLKRIAAHGKYIEDITRQNLLFYATALKKEGCAPRTVRNRIDHFQIFLHHFNLSSLLKGKDLPKFTEKKVRAYNPVELGKMFDHADTDESDLLTFLLCTGAREQEAQYVCWPDVDLERATYTVTEHLDLGYTPKDKEEGTLPLPDLLIDRLKARRKRNPKDRLIFPGKNGKPNGHALRIIKKLALRTGVNCGQCVNKAGKSCGTHPVCRNVNLHKMRKTFATTLHHKKMPAQTIKRYLRHSDLATTLKYIADQPDEEVRETINATFNGFGGAA
jgi:integrase